MLASEPTGSAPWLREMLRFLPQGAEFVLTGNIQDLHLHDAEEGARLVPLSALIDQALRQAGCRQVLHYDPASGFRAPGAEPAAAAAALSAMGLTPGADGTAPGTLTDLARHFGAFLAARGEPQALIVDFASRLINRPDGLSPDEHAAFTAILVQSQRAEGTRHCVVWLVDREGDLPNWFVIGNRRMRHIPVGLPDARTRRRLAEVLLGEAGAEAGVPAASLAQAADMLTFGSQGMRLADIAAIVAMNRRDGHDVTRIRESVHRYKVGTAEDPWAAIDRQRVADGRSLLGTSVKGQHQAIEHLLDIVRRSLMGIGGARRCGPRGFAFFAGPMGSGKKRLGRALAQMLTGHDNAFVYIDMAKHTDAASLEVLFGPSPGVQSDNWGGELTRAMREKPFSVLLLDEIEKAHPAVFDRLLSALDRGYLTSGRGDSVYLCDTFVVFSSNLGLFLEGADGTLRQHVFPTDPYEAVRNKIWMEIEKHFTHTRDRREMLNRIAGNIVYLDFIRPAVAAEVMEHIVREELAQIAMRLGLTVSLSDAARAQLKEFCLGDLNSGAHGIRNSVRWYLVNPLATALFETDVKGPAAVMVDNIGKSGTGNLRAVISVSPAAGG